MTRRRATSPDEAGQAAVELALVLPILLAVVFLLAQVGLLARDRVLVVHAAREAARAAAVEPTTEAAREAALRTRGLDPKKISVATRREGRSITAIVSYRAVTNVRFLGRNLPEISMKEQVTGYVED
ncbi:MAG TPA: TadE family protein [Acidimicrobiales bacterium]|nr:TadE family protein [Acidimicrobiales bacterium]